MSEFLEQVMLVNYAYSTYPDIVCISTLNGVPLTKRLAKKMAQLNPKRGISDMIIMEARGGYHGLVIEFKKTGEKIVKKNGQLYKNDHLREQFNFLKKLDSKKYFATFAIGFKEGKKIIDSYMKESIL